MKDELTDLASHPVRQLVADAVRAMCGQPDRCQVNAEIDGEGRLEIIVEPTQADRGIINGDRGRTWKAIEFITERAAWYETKQVAIARLPESYEGFREGNNGRPTPLTVEQLLALTKRLACAALGREVEIKSVRDTRGWKFVVSDTDHKADDRKVVFALDEILFPAGKANGTFIRVKTERR